MKNLSTHISESFVNEAKDISKLQKLMKDCYEAAKKSKNFKTVELRKLKKDNDFDDDMELYIESKLESLNRRHQNENDEFSMGIVDGELGIEYIPVGDVEEIFTVEQFEKYTRAKE